MLGHLRPSTELPVSLERHDQARLAFEEGGQYRLPDPVLPVNDISQLDPDGYPGGAEFDPDPDEIELDVLADWVETLRLARKTMKIAEEREKEAKETIAAFLAERGADYGTINGQRAIAVRHTSRTYAPSLKTLREVAPEIADAHSFTRDIVSVVLDPK